MEAGGDKEGIWTILESGLRYVAIRSGSSTDLSPFLSASAVASHIPYALKYIMATFGRGRRSTLRRVHVFGNGCVAKRLRAGANRKDLFYYLVCQHIESDIFTSLKPITEWRGPS
jgi:hypothetical protein